MVAVTSTVDDTGVVARGPRLDRRRSARTQGVRRGRLTVYLTSAERALLEARSEVSGESMAKILVDCALHPASAGDGVDAGGVHELVAQLRDYRRQLVGVTTNLNQIARHANTTSEIPSSFSAVLEEIHRLHDDVNAILVGVRRS